MKLLVISAAYPPGQSGEAANAHHLCRHLADSGVDVHVLTSRSNAGSSDAGVTVHPIMRHWSWLEAPRLARFVRHCAPDAVLLMYLGGMYNYRAMVTFTPTIVKQEAPHATVVTRYESPFAGATPRITLAARAGRKLAERMAGVADISYEWGTLLRDSDHVIVLCESHRAVLMEAAPKAGEKVVVIPPPPNVLVRPEAEGATRRRGREKLGVGLDEFVLAFFGYVYPKKGIETLLEAFQILCRERSNVRLVFIGGTLDIDPEASSRYWSEMHRLSAELEVADRTLWTGAFRSDGEEASLYLRAADACVLPLLQGVQLNNSSFSAMAAHGMPVVATRGPMTDQAFVDGENVLLCEPRAPVAMAERISALMDSAELRKRLRVGVTQLLREWLSWDKAIARTIALLEVRR